MSCRSRPNFARNHTCRAAWGALLALAAGGCASVGQPAPGSPASDLERLTRLENLPGKAACFWKSNFQGDWTVLNDSTLIVRAPLPKDAYVVKLFEPVFNLSFKEGLGLEDREHTGEICSNGDDYLVVPGWPSPVPIVAVRVLTRAEQDQLLQAAGKKPVARPPTAAQASPPPQ